MTYNKIIYVQYSENFRQFISLLSVFCCLIKVNRRLLGRWNSDAVSCWSVMIDSIYML